MPWHKQSRLMLVRHKLQKACSHGQECLHIILLVSDDAHGYSIYYIAQASSEHTCLVCR